VLAEALWEGGVPREVLQLVQLSERDLGTQLISDPAVDRVILTGGYETAQLFRSFRPDLSLLAETSGKNAIIVTPSADLDLAVKDVVSSAFGHAGQKCSAASLVILVGSVADSARFTNQLRDAVASLKVGYSSDAATQMGPLIEPANGKLLDALTTLGDGEAWMLEPCKLDRDGQLWSPGVRTGVRRGSAFHQTEYFGPVLGVMSAPTLGEAIAMQNETDFGLTAGIHSLDTAELALWLDTVQAGNLYVNRGITGAIVQRQPFGGWKKSSVGAGTKAGGPNYLVGLGSWVPAHHSAAGEAIIHAGVKGLLTTDDSLSGAFGSDAAAWNNTFGRAEDISALAAERNVFRYLPVPVVIRLSEGVLVSELLRVVGAGLLAGSPLTVSSAVASDALADLQIVVEDDAAWLARVPSLATNRIRLIGGDPAALAAAIGGRPDVAIYSGPVTPAGRIELLPFLREQAVSITAHRFGTPNHLTDQLI
jgi:RHH-type proline utilization regulon transcriptional repressor/proline dehydrogenase/delta 1-pyrroline-5-carboxylate dehydrogenase